ncbi:bacteriocin linocin/CFP29 protein [Arthrobacter crystallopoietes BAB-32]|uniref:Type 1 encapsulin shell protein n=1 Tax=Arthrobacter crystallopoietes BAB-32 TaxID=1246476 RepID=N1V2R0_9MICC|nr:family 1 encapsulin nanocompartment shell protein [Arthrobacter crystallopoietes]EMY34274.1 bacteriocin linocin/CFP29 protein [Arthrobacter crystallopoietes BAB-32]
MARNHLLREYAPISDGGWRLLDEEARQRLTVALGARKLVDFKGPFGWEYSATNLGRTDDVAGALAEGVSALRRRILPLVEVRADFTVSRRELLDHDRGAADVDLSDLNEAALRIASAENVAVFHGWQDAGIKGVTEATPLDPVPRVEDFNDYPKRIAKAVAVLLKEGISGPFGLALGPGHYTAVIETAERGGYLLAEHLRRILDGPIVWAPGVRGAIVMSLRGGDFLFESGQDLSLGYDHHDADNVHLYIEESFSFRVATPEAAIHLTSSS